MAGAHAASAAPRGRLALWLTAAVATDPWSERWPIVIEGVREAAPAMSGLTDWLSNGLRTAAHELLDAFDADEAALERSVKVYGINLRETARRRVREAVADWSLVAAREADERAGAMREGAA